MRPRLRTRQTACDAAAGLIHTNPHGSEPTCSITRSDGHDAPRLIDNAVPVVAAMPDNIVVIAEHPVGQPVVAHELPSVLHHVQLRAFGRQRQRSDVVGQGNLAQQVPSGLIEQQDRVRPRLTNPPIWAKCRFIAAGLQSGRTKAAPFPSCGLLVGRRHQKCRLRRSADPAAHTAGCRAVPSGG